MADPRSQVDAVKAAIQSAATCSASTVTALQGLLSATNQKETSSTSKRAIGARTTKAPVKATTGRKTTAKKAKDTAVEVHQDHNALQPREKHRLATDVVNATLKVLTDSLKPQPKALRRVSSVQNASLSSQSKSRSSSSHRTLKRTSSGQGPLSPVSANEVASRAATPRKIPRTSSCGSLRTGPSAGITAIAECARLAFSYLRNVATEDATKQAAPSTQLENGMLALIGKLIGHGLETLAIKELRILKRRLEGSAPQRSDPATATRGRPTVQTERETVATLLCVELRELSQATLQVLVSYHSLVLRILATNKKPALIEEAARYLQPGNRHSPAAAILRLAELSKDTARAAKQLDTVSRTTLSLCPSASPTADEIASDAKRTPSPKPVLDLQRSALEMQKQWWKLAGHQPDEQKELLQPLAHYLEAFTRRSPPNEDALACADLIADCKPSPALICVKLTFSSIAQSTANFKVAKRWADEGLSTAVALSGDGSTRVILCRLRLASLGILNSADLDIDSLHESTSLLDGPLKGSHEDLIALFKETTTLRRAVTKKLSSEGPHARTCCKATLQLLRFAIRFLGRTAEAGADDATQKAYEKRLALIERVGAQFIDSALLACKTIVSANPRDWELVQSLLQYSGSLAQLAVPAMSVKISNFYWLCHQIVSKSAANDTVPAELSIQLLRRSIEIIKPHAAEHRDGLYGQKLERLGSLLREEGSYKTAWDTLREAAETYLTTDGLVRGKTAITRTLNLLHRSGRRLSDRNTFLDDAQLPVETRGALLEMQLSFFEDEPSATVRREKLQDDLNALFNSLLCVYDIENFPLRRSRACSRMLQLAGDYTFDNELEQAAQSCEIDLKRLGEDRELDQYRQHLSYSLLAAKALASINPDVSDVRDALLFWSGLAEAASTWSDLSQQIDGCEVLIRQLKSVSSFLAVKANDDVRQIVLSTIQRMEELREPSQPSQLLEAAAELALLHTRSGYTGKAGSLYTKHQKLFDTATDTTRWRLAWAEHLVITGKPDEAATELALVYEAASAIRQYPKRDETFANAYYVHAMALLHTGRPNGALSLAKRSARLYQAMVQPPTREATVKKTPPKTSSSSSPVPLGADLDSADTDTKASCESSNSLKLHKSVPDLVRSLLLLSSIYAYQGFHAEALYYSDQAKSLASSAGSPKLELQATTLEIRHLAAVGDPIEEQPLELSASDVEAVAYLIARGDALSAVDMQEDALAEYAKAEKMLMNLQSSASDDLTALTAGMGALALDRKPANRAQPKPTTKRTVTKTAKPSVRATKPKAGAVKTVVKEQTSSSLLFDQLRDTILRQRGLLLLKGGDYEAAYETLQQMSNTGSVVEDMSKYQVALTRGLLQKADSELVSDFTYNILPESTVSFPALSSTDRRQSQLGLPRSSLISPGKPSATTDVIKPRGQKQAEQAKFVLTLRDAREGIASIQAKSASTSSTAMLHQICSLASESTVLLSATNHALPKGSLHPVRAALSMELPRVEAARREIAAMELDKRPESRDELLRAPAELTVDPSATLGAARFQQEYIDIIPEAWTAVSLGLSEDCTELYITRFQAGQTPFILRLPMTRQKAHEMDEETGFTFEAGKDELSEIINLSNYSCHNTGDTSVKGAKTVWWAEREALDRRLHELLINIENIWLGGFRGVLSQHSSDSHLLARFRKSFENILDRHLPSRQGSKGKAKKLSLDSRVLELFIGLGDDKDGTIDLDEQLLDLLYFVIDILQFHGERNAYDEVDFDSLAIETLDAMRAYHEAAAVIDTADKHMILILDKRLHAFPWENLPCLDGVSVSRVGSMLTLRERILAMRRQQQHSSAEMDRYTTSKARGAYILNPSGDLTATQSTLSPLLSSLRSASPSWTAMVKQAPSETDFTTALQQSNMLLYFGHGSGNQYVRNRAIKKLDRCADVVWLMGCSSGAVSEFGCFEPSSVPLSYLVAGRSRASSSSKGREGAEQEDSNADADTDTARDGLCMAVVATLWDVTDKDIDRFSVRVGEEWGLWSAAPAAEAPAPKTPAKRGRGAEPKTPRTPGRSRSRAANATAAGMRDCGRGGGGGGKASLSAAVARSREACYLRYLNGAAAVVYGVPVYLGD